MVQEKGITSSLVNMNAYLVNKFLHYIIYMYKCVSVSVWREKETANTPLLLLP